MEKTQTEKIKAALQKIGIITEEDLKHAIKNLPPLKIQIMTGRIPAGKEKGDIWTQKGTASLQ